MTDKYAVIGNPIGHTKSPMIHGSFAKDTGQDIDYVAIEGSLEHFADDVHAFRKAGGLGMNVTAPFKLQAFALATERLERAELAGATNALKFEGDRIIADNFDGVGLTNDIQRNLGFALKGARMLVLGAGGAVRGALLPFLAQQPELLVLANRTESKASDLATQLGAHGRVHSCSYGDLARERFDIVINGTSASLKAELPPVPAVALRNAKLAYELAYGKGLTPFLRLAHNAGVPKLADGVGMLVEQAAEAFVWWRGVRPDTRAVIDRMTIPLV
ncbi:shikimate dehydrogenase [Variovorax sp. YR216]|uniref:shikimate dehydrogenase n=1 Tax=Variovorax sp. YR216 TaxID=1882828 RepID=UPI00089919E4|nr:shikimate dehydrogenase [Variovorax sp. YR216]SEB26457.1 shikimate dehydrogenase [Variovorax sp. YR216]